MDSETFKVKYIGKDTPSLRNGKIYEATHLKSRGEIVKTSYSVKDEDNDTFAYSSSLFEVVK